jgi:hypothetical protein
MQPLEAAVSSVAEAATTTGDIFLFLARKEKRKE